MEELKMKGIETVVDSYLKGLDEKVAGIETKLAPYSNGVVAEDTLAEWKKDRASINKERKSFNDERILLEKAWKGYIAPITKAYKKVDEMYSVAIMSIDKQTATFEEQRKAEKMEQVQNIWNSFEKPVEIADWLTLGDVKKDSWLNKGTSEKDIINDIQMSYDSLMISYNSIVALGSKFEKEALATLRDTKVLPLAIKRISELTEMEEIVERKKQEEKPKSEIQSIREAIDEVFELEEDFEPIVFPSAKYFTEIERHIISKVFQNYYCNGISQIAEEDEILDVIFRKVGIL